ncbi:MAG: HAD family hydrolase [Bacillota bacterium]
MIKLVAFDLDKTLLDNQGRLPSDFLEQQNKLMKMGIQIAVVTTQPYGSVKKLFGDAFAHLIGACGNGNCIFGNDIYEILHRYEKADILHLLDFLPNDPELAICFSGHQGDYTDPISLERFHQHEKSWLIPNVLDIEEYYQCGDEIYNASFLCFPPDQGMDFSAFADEKCKTTLKNVSSQYKLTHAGYGWISVLPHDCGKRLGLQKVMESIKATKDEVLAFGDSDNDIPMFELVTHSFAMKNADKNVKEHALHITEYDNNQNGAMRAVFDFLSK